MRPREILRETIDGLLIAKTNKVSNKPRIIPKPSKIGLRCPQAFYVKTKD